MGKGTNNKVYILNILLLVIIFTAMFCLWRQNRSLKIQNSIYRKQVSPLFIDDDAPSIEVTNLAGFKETIRFGYRGNKSLVFILPKSCVPCEKNIVFWKRLYEQVINDIEVIGVIVGGMQQAVALRDVMKVGFPLYVPENADRLAEDFKVSVLSLTLLVKEDGKIGWMKGGDINADDYLELKDLVLKNN